MTIVAFALIVAVIFIWLFILAAMVLMLYGGLTTRVPFVPVPRIVLEALKKEMPLSAGDTLYDFGSGDGRVVLGMAAAFPAARTTGVEKAPYPYLLARFWLSQTGIKNARFLFKNFADVLVHDATHIYLYLYPETVQKLLPKFEKELKRGSVVVSCDFPFARREPTRTIPIERGGATYTLYFYDF